MRFVFVAAILAIAEVATAQTAQAVTIIVQGIANATNLLLSDTQQITGIAQGLPWELQLQQDAVQIYRLVNNGTTAAQASSVFDENGSFQVAVNLVSLTNTVELSLGNLSAKAQLVGQLGPVVLASLYQLKSASDVFANATIAKLSASYQGVAPSVKGQLDTAFNNAIVTYGGKPLAG